MSTAPTATPSDDRAAVALYAIGAREFTDFLDMLPEATLATLELLQKMLSLRGRPNTDDALNKLMLGPVEREIERRR